MSAAEREAIIKSGRAHLRAWLESAERHGTIYYSVPHVARSGMSRRIVLQTIAPTPRRDKGSGVPLIAQVQLSLLWPNFDGKLLNPYSGKPGFDECLDVVAKDWGFSFQHRAFVIGGCGMDMVFALVDDLAHKAELSGQGRESYANRVRRESFT